MKPRDFVAVAALFAVCAVVMHLLGWQPLEVLGTTFAAVNLLAAADHAKLWPQWLTITLGALVFICACALMGT